MAPEAKPRIALILALATIGFLYLLFLLSIITLMVRIWTSHSSTLPSAPGSLREQDFSTFWLSGRWILIRLRHEIGITIVPDTQMIWFKNDIAIADKPLVLGWLYPPTMGLLATLYAILPLAVSFWVWRIIFLAVSATLLRKAGLRWTAIIMGLAGPAELIDFFGGQNGALTGGLIVSGLLMIDRRPFTAGTIAGLLCIKPQLGLMLPFILLRKQRLKALSACALCVLTMIGLTLPIMGWDAWLWFITGALRNSTNLVSIPLHQRFAAAGATVFFMARSFHASPPQAWVLQSICSGVSAFATWHLWRGVEKEPVARMALTICLWILMTPYGYLYDSVGFSIAMAAMFFRVPDRDRPVFGVLWLAGGYAGTAAKFSGHLLFPIAALFGAWFIWRVIGVPTVEVSTMSATQPHARNPA